MDKLRTLLVFADGTANETLSYQRGWPRHFPRHKAFDCHSLNLLDPSRAKRALSVAEIATRRYDVVVLLHSVFSNQQRLVGPRFQAMRMARGPIACFLGNEYKLMPEKMAFCEDLDVCLLVSQSTSSRVHAMYHARLGCDIVSLPNGGLDTDVYKPMRAASERSIDIGFRAEENPLYLGHDDKRVLADTFDVEGPKRGLKVDISLDRKDRFDEVGWADFLNRCRGVVGAEAGGDYFEITDATRLRVNAYVHEHPNVTRAEIVERFFRDYKDPVPARMLASRHIEAAGTRTVQILFEGLYGGEFQPHEHYIPLRKDLSNLDEVFETFADPAACARIAENAYRKAVSDLTYERLIDRFHAALVSAMESS